MHSRYLVLLLATILLTLILKHTLLDSKDPYRCRALLTEGRWSQELDSNKPRTTWQPRGCVLHRYDSRSLTACLRSRKLIFIGDSTARQVFWETARRLNNKTEDGFQARTRKHSDAVFWGKEDEPLSSLTYFWDPFLNETSAKYNQHAPLRVNGSLLIPFAQNEGQQTVAIVGGGLWHAKHLESSFDTVYESDWTDLVYASMHSFLAASETSYTKVDITFESPHLWALPVIPPEVIMLEPQLADSFDVRRILQLNSKLHSLEQSHPVEISWSLESMVEGSPSARTHDGGYIHLNQDIVAAQTDVLLNRICNPVVESLAAVPGSSSYCCISTPTPTLASGILLAAAVVILITCALLCGCTKLWPTLGLSKSSLVPKPLLNSFGLLSLSLIYLYAADRTALFTKSAKVTSEFDFILLLILVLVPGVCTVRKRVTPTWSDPLSFLPRAQTEEWKGWMQAYILLYHYFGMSKVLWAYRIARVCVASYLYLTGYGHTTSILHTGGPKWSKVVAGLFKLNLLSCLIAIVMNTSYDFYYFPTLVSFWYLVAQATWIGVDTEALSMRDAIFRIMVSSCIVNILVRNNWLMDAFITGLQMIVGLSINTREALFRILLDIHVVYLGMLFAVWDKVDVRKLLKSPTSSLDASEIMVRMLASLCKPPAEP